jgi:hypothetical protein
MRSQVVGAFDDHHVQAAKHPMDGRDRRIAPVAVGVRGVCCPGTRRALRSLSRRCSIALCGSTVDASVLALNASPADFNAS